MVENNKNQAPGADANPDIHAPKKTQKGVNDNPQTQTPQEMATITEGLKEQNDRFESNLERLEDAISTLDKALNAMASAKGLAPMVQRERIEFNLKDKTKK